MKTKSMVLSAAAGLLALGALSPSFGATPAVISERTISVDAALRIATAALEKCRADGYIVSITVLNRHARPTVVLADDGINPHTLQNSERKAYTAFTTKMPSVEMGKRTQPGLAGFLLLDKVTTIEGGLPIMAGKELIGAIGISGAPGGDKDAACAQYGLDKVAKEFN
jgi:uncharacterized protein GlcG (DUF336 family)